MRLLLNFFIILFIGLLVGGITAQYSLRQSHGLGAINVGVWSAWPFVGGIEVDPYTLARSTTDGILPLGAAEGLAFESTTDQNGFNLDLKCNYEISGFTPPARLWTLAAYLDDGKIVKSESGKPAAIHSGNVIRYPDNSFLIKMEGSPQSGNWVGLSGTGSFNLVLRLYDTPITNNSDIIPPQMPGIVRTGCN